MLRAILLASLVLAGCRHDTDPPPMQPREGELPPLPPASGTTIGYLLDNAGVLVLRDDQFSQLKDIDRSLAARNEVIDTQLRLIERPDEKETEKGQPPARHNNAPGAQVRTTADAGKLHEARKDNDTEALKKAFALLDATQQTTARRLLEDRGVVAPGSQAKKPTRSPEDGVPLN